jgi:LmbE family N-acetylglucosaminyl deacetylase
MLLPRSWPRVSAPCSSVTGPQVIITHNANDKLQHPDHVHAG